MNDPDFQHITNILKVVQGFVITGGIERIPPIIAAAALIVEAEGVELTDVLSEVENEESDVALVKLAHRFIMKAKSHWGSDDFEKIIKLECDAIRNGAQ